MATGPVPVPKYLEIARRIEARIAAGEMGAGKFPSARAIAGTHGVSLVTASRALQVLRDKGLIRTVERSGSYLADDGSAAEIKERWALVLRSTTGPWRQASLSYMEEGFGVVGRREGIHFEVDRFDFDDLTPLEELRRQVKRGSEAGVSGVIMLPSRADVRAADQDETFLKTCRDAGLAVVLIERNLRGLARPLEYDLIAADDFDGGLRCTRHLLEKGRKRVAFVIGSPTSSHEGRLAGYLTALHRAGPGFAPLVFEQPAGLSTKAAYEALAELVLAHQADAVVCYQDYTALGLILELLTRGTRVPKDVALTGFDNLPIGKAFAIGVSTFAFSSEALASQAARVMRARLDDPSGPAVKVSIPGKLIVRESSDTD